MPVSVQQKLPAEWRRENDASRKRHDEQIFKYVVWGELEDYLKMGWIRRMWLDGTHHGIHATYVEWLCDCRVPLRKPDADHRA